MVRQIVRASWPSRLFLVLCVFGLALGLLAQPAGAQEDDDEAPQSVRGRLQERTTEGNNPVEGAELRALDENGDEGAEAPLGRGKAMHFSQSAIKLLSPICIVPCWLCLYRPLALLVVCRPLACIRQLFLKQ